MAEPQVEHRKLLLRIRSEPEDGLRLVQVPELRARPHDAALAERSVVEGGVEGAEVEVGGADDVAEEQAGGVEILVGGVRAADEADGGRAVLGDGRCQPLRNGVEGVAPRRVVEGVRLSVRPAPPHERGAQAVGVGDVAVAVAALVAVPEQVDRVVGQRLRPQHLVAAALHREGAPHGAERAGRRRRQEVPRPGEEAVRLGRERAHRADLDGVAGEVGVERLGGPPVDLRHRPPVEQLDLLVARDLPAEPHAAPAEHAALPVEHHQLGERDGLAEVTLLLPVAAPPRAEVERLVLQRALAAAVADRAVEGVVDEQQFQDRALRLDGGRRVGVDHHPVGHGGGARREQLAGALDLDEAHAARRHRVHAGVVAEPRDEDTVALRHVDEQAPVLGRHLVAVDRQPDAGVAGLRRHAGPRSGRWCGAPGASRTPR